MSHIQVLEGNEADAAVNDLKKVVAISSQEDGSPNVDLLKRSDFVVAPVMHKGSLNAEILEKFFDAIKPTGRETITAIGLYNAEEQHCYQLPASLDALKELRGTSCGVINFALYAGDPDWVILFDDQIYVAYGPEPFVKALVGDIDSAFTAVETRLNELYQQAQEDIPGYAIQEINRMGEYLDAALSKLGNDYNNAPEGELVNVV